MIPQNIQDLVSLALKDGVLTYKERQVIVNEAKKMRVETGEINSFINSALDNKLKFIPKESLKRCPTCGAQIPLISDQCLYCGFEFGQEISVSNYSAAQIIESENTKTQSVFVKSDEPIKNCPDCGAPYPLLGNICPHCNHVHHERADNMLNIKNLINNIKKSLSTMDKCMVPLMKSIKRDHAFYLIPVAGLLMTLTRNLEKVSAAFDSMSGIPFLLSLGLMVYIGITLMFRFSKGSAISEADEIFCEKESDYEKFIRHTDTLYGINQEAKDLLAKFDGEIRKVKRNRLQNRIAYYLFCIASGLLIWLMISKGGSIDDNTKLSDLRRHIPCGVITDDGKLAEAGNTMKLDGVDVLSQGFLTSKDNVDVNLNGVKLKLHDKSELNNLSVLFFNGNGEIIKCKTVPLYEHKLLELGPQEFSVNFICEGNAYAIMNTAKSFSIIRK